MLILRSVVKVADNSGAIKAMVIKTLGKGPKTPAKIGDKVTVVIKEANLPRMPRSSRTPVPPLPPRLANRNSDVGKVRKGEVHKAVIIRTKSPLSRDDGTSIRFADNACVLVNDAGEPLGTRVTGPVGKELRGGFGRVIQIADAIA